MAVPFYRYSFETARADHSADWYRKSAAENNRLCSYVDNDITGLYVQTFQEFHTEKVGAYMQQLVECFGLERTAFVLANSIRLYSGPGLISGDSKVWAEQIGKTVSHEGEQLYRFDTLPSGVLDILAKRIRGQYPKLAQEPVQTSQMPQTLEPFDMAMGM